MKMPPILVNLAGVILIQIGIGDVWKGMAVAVGVGLINIYMEMD